MSKGVKPRPKTASQTASPLAERQWAALTLSTASHCGGRSWDAVDFSLTQHHPANMLDPRNNPSASGAGSYEKESDPDDLAPHAAPLREGLIPTEHPGADRHLGNRAKPRYTTGME